MFHEIGVRDVSLRGGYAGYAGRASTLPRSRRLAKGGGERFPTGRWEVRPQGNLLAASRRGTAGAPSRRDSYGGGRNGGGTDVDPTRDTAREAAMWLSRTAAPAAQIRTRRGRRRRPVTRGGAGRSGGPTPARPPCAPAGSPPRPPASPQMMRRSPARTGEPGVAQPGM